MSKSPSGIIVVLIDKLFAELSRKDTWNYILYGIIILRYQCCLKALLHDKLFAEGSNEIAWNDILYEKITLILCKNCEKSLKIDKWCISTQAVKNTVADFIDTEYLRSLNFCVAGCLQSQGS